MSGHVRLKIDGAVARVTLSNPAKFNAMSRAMWRELRQVFTELQQRTDVRAVLVAGEGGHFCAGGDIAEYSDFRFHPEGLRDFHENDVWGGLSAMMACDLPIVAQIEGNCMGAGVEITSCCDIRVAGQGARFGAPIAKLGFPMAPREAELVAREVGLATARQMLLEAAVLDAPTMLARGFLQTVLHDAEVPAEALQRAERMTRLAPLAARLNKQALRALAGGQGVEALLPTAYDYADSPEHREGIAAFLAKRPPHF
ncbi:enoyl-CoA hydratase/isomerase family protein [Hydrogenophaga taeniospiralis]|uniref:enoyl-CoA hydratase/isomerase family protein n=1 Tax=Hydrogenophaga taeniospiralis TaxID=65656 RepID=UPI001CF9CD7A|nr:enoyl-CoA hydratase/isomerase family protein [Hydrogenophaga taeniospiralis]UCU96309.1 enoyl-CoA hydratase/isomerase family protein [Hydrogenophaga taeniospiralis]